MEFMAFAGQVSEDSIACQEQGNDLGDERAGQSTGESHEADARGRHAEERAHSSSTPDGRRSQVAPVRTEAEAMPMQRGKDLLQELITLAQIPGVVLRFHALRALSGVWKLVSGHRITESSRAHANLMELSHSGFTQLLLLRLRPANMRRSPLAQRVGNMLTN